MYKCKFCGKEFEKQQSYAFHTGKCKLNPNRDNAIKHLAYARSCRINFTKNDNIEYNCKYCHKICIGKNSLAQHELRCKENPNKINFVSNFIKYNKDCSDGIIKHHLKGKTKETSESLQKMCETRKKRYESGEIHGSFLNHHHTEESKEKLRKLALEYLEKMKNISCPRYNIKSINYINNLNEQNNWHLQHAENGGEIEIGGYFLDGYDKDLNIVFEYDEERHYKDVINNVLSDRDIKRQNYIINKLNCKFYRYNEYLDYFYQVN